MPAARPGESGRRTSDRPRPRSPRPVAFDAFVAVVVLGAGAYWFHLTRHGWFRFDEWALTQRGGSVRDLLRPYNGHLSITYIGAYRTLYELIGFRHYWVFRLLGIGSLLSVGVSLYLTHRSRVGPAVAGLAAFAVLWLDGVSLEPGGFNHTLTLTTGIVVAFLLEGTGRRRDAVLGLVLALGLSTSGGAVAVTVAAVVHTLLTRPALTRWVAVGLPTLLWGCWWAVEGRDALGIPDQFKLSRGEGARVVAEGLFAAFRGLAAGSAVIGGLLVVGFLVLAATSLRRRGLRGSATLVAWTTAAGFWWVALVQSRGPLAVPETFRYQLVAATFLVIAALSCWPDRLASIGWSRWAQGAAVVLVLASGVTTVGPTRTAADIDVQLGGVARQQALVAGLQPSVVDGDVRHPLLLGELTQRQLEAAFRRYGSPSPPRAQIDRQLVHQRAVTLSVRDGRAPGACRAQPDQVVSRPFIVRAGDRPAEVVARRFGSDFITVGTVPPESTATVGIRADVDTDATWEVRVRDACSRRGA